MGKKRKGSIVNYRSFAIPNPYFRFCRACTYIIDKHMLLMLWRMVRSWNKNKKLRPRFLLSLKLALSPHPPSSAYKEIKAFSLSFLLLFLLSVWKVEGGEGWNRFNRRQKSVIFLTYYCSTNREEKLRIKEV